MDLHIEKRPRSRGVTQLMYVGDDDAVESAVRPSHRELVVGAVLAGLAAVATKGTTRTVLAGFAAWAAYKATRTPDY